MSSIIRNLNSKFIQQKVIGDVLSKIYIFFTNIYFD